jgi:hypothetical protein
MSLPLVGPTIWDHFRINKELILTFVKRSKVPTKFGNALGGACKRIIFSHGFPHIFAG